MHGLSSKSSIHIEFTLTEVTTALVPNGIVACCTTTT